MLHDAGHSPFSHTGEDFYYASTIFEQEFQDLIQSSDFDRDVVEQGTGKPHEAMSAMIGMKLLEKMNVTFEKLQSYNIVGLLCIQRRSKSLA